MTPPEDDLRAAMRATAEKIPPGPPPLTLPKHRRLIRPSSVPGYRSPAQLGFSRWRPCSWLARSWPARWPWRPSSPGTAALVSGPFPPQPLHVPDVPAYYVALTSADGKIPGYGARGRRRRRSAPPPPGRCWPPIAVPRPYHAFTGVTAAADDHTFVLVAAEGPGRDPQRSLAPPARYYVLHFDPASPTAAERVRLAGSPGHLDTGRPHGAGHGPVGQRHLAGRDHRGPRAAASCTSINSPPGTQHFWYADQPAASCTAAGIGPRLCRSHRSRAPSPGPPTAETLAFMFFFGRAPGIRGVRLLDKAADMAPTCCRQQAQPSPMSRLSSPVRRRGGPHPGRPRRSSPSWKIR